MVFAFRRQGARPIWYGLVGLGSVGGNFGGALLAPRLRRRVNEVALVAGAAALIGVTAIGVAQLTVTDRRVAALILASATAVGASAAKTAFDAIAQRDTADADRGRLFARFNSLFQASWVIGALIPTLIATALLTGFILTAVIVAVTTAAFLAVIAGRSTASRRTSTHSGQQPRPG